MDLNMNIWGPHYWFIIHTIAMTYPKIPGSATKKRYYKFYQDLPHFLPHKSSRKLFTQILEKFPITPYLDSKESSLRQTYICPSVYFSALELHGVHILHLRTPGLGRI